MADTPPLNAPANTADKTTLSEYEAWKWLIVMLSFACLLITVVLWLYPHMPTDSSCDACYCKPAFIRLFMAAMCGALGATIFVMNTYVTDWGNGALYTFRGALFLVKPALGAALAIVFFFLSGSPAELHGMKYEDSTNSLLSLCFLVGMFTDMAINKASTVVKTLFGIQ